MPSHLEEQFARQWLVSFPELPFVREYSLPVYKTWAQYQKDVEARRRKPPPFRADFAWPGARVAVEINGGIWQAGGHSTGRGITRDMTKVLLAQLSGWCLLPLSASHINGITWYQFVADLVTERQGLFHIRSATGTLDQHSEPRDQGIAAPQRSRANYYDGNTPPGQCRRRIPWGGVDLREALKYLRRGEPEADP